MPLVDLALSSFAQLRNVIDMYTFYTLVKDTRTFSQILCLKKIKIHVIHYQ